MVLCIVSVYIILVAPSPLRSAKTRRLHLGRESLESALFGRAGQTVAPLSLESCRFRLGREIRALVFRSRKYGHEFGTSTREDRSKTAQMSGF